MKNKLTTVKQTISLINDLLLHCTALKNLNDKLIVEVEHLTKRELEAGELISRLLADLESVEAKAMILEIQPKAKIWLSTSKAARTRKATDKAKTEARVWEALVNDDKPKAGLMKRIGRSTGLSPQYVGKVIKRWSIEP